MNNIKSEYGGKGRYYCDKTIYIICGSCFTDQVSCFLNYVLFVSYVSLNKMKMIDLLEILLKRLFLRKTIYLIIFLCACTCILLKWAITRNELVPKHLQGFVRFEEGFECLLEPGPGTGHSAGALRTALERRNREREVRNVRAHGPVTKRTPVLVVLAARDAARLQYLIVSLAQVRDISSTLLIFSHSFYDERVEDLVRTIQFCKVMQIYFPNSLQLTPEIFPGASRHNLTDAAEHPHRRLRSMESQRSERKRHWWWTTHTVFAGAGGWTRGYVMFVEEDSYVLPDLLHVQSHALAALPLLPHAQLMALGRPPAHHLTAHELTLDAWRPTFARGLAFNTSMWRKIKELAGFFCGYDDASWSHSLAHALTRLPQGAAVMIASVSPRILATSGRDGVQAAMSIVEDMRRHGELFPSRMEVTSLWRRGGVVYHREEPAPSNGGGWTDARDLVLCLEPMAVPTTEDDSTTIPPVFTASDINSETL